MLDVGFIYKISQIDSDHCYIGCTKNFDNRKAQHIMSCSYKPDFHLYRHINEYGLDQFEFKIIDVYYNIERKLLNSIEGEYIQKYANLNKRREGVSDEQRRRENKIYRNTFINCDICNIRSMRKNYSRHKKTKSHIRNLESQTETTHL